MPRTATKSCVFLLQPIGGQLHCLAFRHPLAGCQWIKGGIESGETAAAAAKRELYEESGLIAPEPPITLTHPILGANDHDWALFAWRAKGLPRTWRHETMDGGGLTFAYYWHPVGTPLDARWHHQFRPPYFALQRAIKKGLWRRLQKTPPIRSS